MFGNLLSLAIVLVAFGLLKIECHRFMVDSVIPSPLRNPEWPHSSRENGQNGTNGNGMGMSTMARDLRILTVINLMEQVIFRPIMGLLINYCN
jgi:hypothetical protein